MCLQWHTFCLNNNLIQLNINVHGTDKVIRYSILSAGESLDACSRALSTALNNKEIASIMAVTSNILPKIYANAITRHEQKKFFCPMQHMSVINENRQKIEKLFSYPIFCPLCHIHQIKQIKMKFMQLRIYLNVACQVHIAQKNASKNVDLWLLRSTIQQGNGLSNHVFSEQKKLASHWDRN